jgi:hypothetical protein
VILLAMPSIPARNPPGLYFGHAESGRFPKNAINKARMGVPSENKLNGR